MNRRNGRRAVAPLPYYVDVTAGSDSNHGHSSGKPKQTPGATFAVKPGGDVRFKRGETWPTTSKSQSAQWATLATAGKPGRPVTWGAYGVGVDPIFDAGQSLMAPTYKWTASGGGTNEWYCELIGGGDPSFTQTPYELMVDNERMYPGTIGALDDHAWGYGDGDALGYSTVYFRDDTGDPDGSGIVISGTWMSHGLYVTAPRVRIQDVQIHNIRGDAIRTSTAAPYLEVRRVHTQYCSVGIESTARYHRVHHCHFQNGLFMHSGPVYFGVNGVLTHYGDIDIHHCEFDDLDDATPTLPHEGAALEIYIDTDVTGGPISFHHNIIQRCCNLMECGSESNVEDLERFLFYRNVTIDTRKWLSWHDDGVEALTISGGLYYEGNVWSNTLNYVALEGGKLPGTVHSDVAFPATLVMRNNVFVVGWFVYCFEAGAMATATHDHNVWYKLFPATTLNVVPGVTDIVVDPCLRDIAGLDLQLRSDSPAIGAGAAPVKWLDFAGAPGVDDIGAYEMAAGYTTSGVISSDTFTRGDSATNMSVIEAGTPWTPRVGTWGIDTNRAYCVSDVAYENIITDVGTQNGTLACTINGNLNNVANYRIPGLVLRWLDDDNYLMVRMYNGNVELRKRDGGVNSDLSVTATTTADETDYVLSVVLAGNDINVSVGGVEKIDYTLEGDDVKYIGTRHGLHLTKGGTPTAAAFWDAYSFTV